MSLAYAPLDLSAPAVLAAALICLARICDVTLGTLRAIYTMRGRKYVATGLAFCEVTIFILAISSVLVGGIREPLRIVGYILGYGTGVFIGISIEGWIAYGWTMLRIVSREQVPELVERLRKEGVAVTQMMGEGRDGPVPILFIVLRRKRTKKVLRLVREIAPKAFVTVESVVQAIGGTLPGAPIIPFRTIVRK